VASGLPRRRVDDFHAGVAQVRGDDAAAAIMAVEADLGDENFRADIHWGLIGGFVCG
jgi:hypothetical protein